MTDDDEELEFRGPFARALRPMSYRTCRSIAASVGVLYLFAGVAAFLVPLGWTHLAGANRLGLAFVGTACFIAGLFVLSMLRMQPATVALVYPWCAAVGFVLGTVLVALNLVFFGPTFGGGAVFLSYFALIAFFAMRVPWATATTAMSMAGLAIALVVLDDPVAPGQLFANVLAAAVPSGVFIGIIANRLEAASRAERKAKTALRRFVSAEVADVIVSSGAEDMLAPHQCEVAVLFVDLRGFTSFTNNVSADHIVHVLSEYYAAVGEVLVAHGATIGGFDGDGVMAFVGDPVPHDKPAHDAVRMAGAIAARLDELVDDWAVGEHQLGYGIGVTFGVATLGVVGFEGRYDYTAVGPVVNLAARLCANAAAGEIVVDNATRESAGLDGEVASRGDVALKGFGVTKTYAVSH